MTTWSVGSIVVGILGSALAWAIRRYRRSLGSDLQSFTAYVYGSIKLSIGRRFSPLLASQFGIKQYANRALAVFPRYLVIPSVHQFKLELEHAYIRLSLSSSPRRKILDASLLAHEPGGVLVFGEPGSGKSSLTRKLYREACLQAYVRPFQSRLPIHIELRRLNWAAVPKEDDGSWLVNELEAAVMEMKGLHDPGFVFRAFADGPGLVTFLDGLDEIPITAVQPAVTAIERAIRRLRRRSPSTSVVLTSRSQLRASLPNQFLDSFDDVLTVEPFSLADIFVFLGRWPFTGPALVEAQRIFEQLGSNPTLLEMCTNPLVLSMYVAYDQRASDAEAIARLPDTRTDFYKEVIGELLFYRRQAQIGPAMAGSQVRKAREQLLGQIALDHLASSNDPANSISYDRALELTRAHLGAARTDKAAEELIQLGVATGLFAIERAGESIRFMHLTVCEYLAAKELSEQNDEDFTAVSALVGRPDSLSGQRLWEVVIFAVALAGRARRNATLSEFDASRVSDELVCRAVRESQAYDHPAFGAVLDRMTGSVADKPHDQWTAEWFRQVGVLLSCLADTARLASVKQGLTSFPSPSEWLEKLVGDNTEKLDRVFDLYLAESPAEALRAARQFGLVDRLLSDGERIIAAFERPDFIALCITEIADSPQPDIRWIRHLAEAAMRYELVAQVLHDESPVESLERMTSTVSRDHHWHRVGPARGTLLGQILSVAVDNVAATESASPRRVSRVELISHLRTKPTQRKRYVTNTRGRLEDEESLLQAVLKLRPTQATSAALEWVILVDLGRDFIGMFVSPECLEWAQLTTFRLSRSRLGRMTTGLELHSEVRPDSGVRTPRHLAKYYNTSPLGQVRALIDVIDDLWWLPAQRGS